VAVYVAVLKATGFSCAPSRSFVENCAVLECKNMIGQDEVEIVFDDSDLR
jgi:hypothetical protein